MKSIKNNESNFLFNFIDEKVSDYIEPTREGTPRGEPIGLSAQKYMAVLVSLFNTRSVKRKAELSKISYGLLRKWRTEDQFREVFKRTEIELAERIENYITSEIEREFKSRDEFVRGVTGEFEWANLIPVYNIARELTPGVIDGLAYAEKRASEAIKRCVDDDKAAFLGRIANEIEGLIAFAQTGEIRARVDIDSTMALVSFARDIIKSKEKLSNQDRRQLALSLTGVLNDLKHLAHIERRK